MRYERFVAACVCGFLAGVSLVGCGSSGGDKPADSAAPATQTTAASETDDLQQWANDLAPWAKRASEQPEEPFPTVVLKTSLGELKIKLNRQQAPRTVANFLGYVDGGHYNQTIFHQVEAGYVALGGSFTPELTPKEGRYPIPNEAANGLKNRRGTIAMARSPDQIDSSTCQFFINLNDNPQLDHQGEQPEAFGYCVFGEVVEGMEVLDRLSSVPVRSVEGFDKLPTETVLLESARRMR